MNTLDFVAVVFAAGAIIEVWHKGSIFETARAYVQSWQDTTPPETFKGRLWELVMCPFCKSYHIPIYLFLLLLAGDWAGGTMAALVRVVVYGLAATRIGNLIDGLLPNKMKYDPPLILFGEEHGRSVAGPADVKSAGEAGN
jgi:hypothetical protein